MKIGASWYFVIFTCSHPKNYFFTSLYFSATAIKHVFFLHSGASQQQSPCTRLPAHFQFNSAATQPFFFFDKYVLKLFVVCFVWFRLALFADPLYPIFSLSAHCWPIFGHQWIRHTRGHNHRDRFHCQQHCTPHIANRLSLSLLILCAFIACRGSFTIGMSCFAVITL